MRHLCDSNVLLACVVERHPHHSAALNWLDSLGPQDTAALCRVTQISFLRLLATEAVLKQEVQTNAAAIAVLSELMDDSRFQFVGEEPVDLQRTWLKMASLRTASSKTWMDTYLAAFAYGHGMRLVTFDRALDLFRKSAVDVLLLS
jgi:toxin-antitoxin system PIN domain toxin